MANDELNKLLRYDLETFAVQTGFKKKINNKLTTKDAVKLLNLAEDMSRNITNNDMRNKCLMICGLIWEHRRPEWEALPNFLIKILTRIGLASSAKMLDDEFDIVSDTFSDRGSILDEFYLSSEFLKSEVEVMNRTLLLSSFQKSMWDGIDAHSRFGISAPTSAGKSFILVQKIIDMFDKGASQIVYIVPTISLIGQVTRDLLKLIKENRMTDVYIHQSFREDDHFNYKEKKVVYVLTQERASLITKINHNMNIDLLVIDEVQNIERVARESDDRSQLLYELIQEFHLNINPNKIAISGPRIEKINELVTSLFGKEAKGISDEVPPILNFTYTFKKVNGKLYMRLYNGIDKEPVTTMLDNTKDLDINFFGKKVYNDKILKFMSHLVNNISRGNIGTIIFAPTSDSATKIAREINTSTVSDVKLDSLKDYIRDTVHKNYFLIDCIDRGIAYHHGKMPNHIRNAVEKAFKNLVINKIVCTTTLMQGVNLPAKNIITRNPNLFIKAKSDGENPKLTGYEFSNLRGRAGRLMNDFVGRSIVLDEPAFEDAQIDVFDHPKKEVVGGYADRFENNKTEIIEELTEDTSPIKDLNDFNSFDIVVYIRQMVLRYGENAKDRLKRTGVAISHDEIKKIQQHLKEITVSKEICVANRYWDPFVIQKIYNEMIKVDVPSSPFENGYVKKILSLINKIREITPYYYEKYFGIYQSNRIYARVIAAQQWSQEVPLKVIIDEKESLEDQKAIDTRLDLINKDVMYSLPKLLQPVFSIQKEENNLLLHMEYGAYKPLTKKYIDLGVPREIAIKITRIIEENYFFQADVEDKYQLIKSLKQVLKYLNYWEVMQIEDLIY